LIHINARRLIGYEGKSSLRWLCLVCRATIGQTGSGEGDYCERYRGIADTYARCDAALAARAR